MVYMYRKIINMQKKYAFTCYDVICLLQKK